MSTHLTTTATALPAPASVSNATRTLIEDNENC